MRQFFAVLVLLGVALTTSACIVEEPGHEHNRCGFWHHCHD
jgi:hypothetical protein